MIFIGKNCRVIRIEAITEFVNVCQMSEEEQRELNTETRISNYLRDKQGDRSLFIKSF